MPGFYIEITPNLHIANSEPMKSDEKNEQKRSCSPLESIQNGADAVIMGRSLINGNIEENLSKVSNSLKL